MGRDRCLATARGRRVKGLDASLAGSAIGRIPGPMLNDVTEGSLAAHVLSSHKREEKLDTRLCHYPCV
jgi:hypothetical protein